MDIVEQLRDIRERFIFQGNSGFAQTLADTIEALRKQVAELTKELEGQYVVTDVQVFDDTSSAVKIMELQNQLAAAQARIVELREALHGIAIREFDGFSPDIAKEVLATLDDSSALDRRLQKEYLRGYHEAVMEHGG